MGRLFNITDEEWQNRVDLAACYHLANHFNMSDIIWNHITAKTYAQKDTFLINKFGLRYDEVSASNLLEIDHLIKSDSSNLPGEYLLKFFSFIDGSK